MVIEIRTVVANGVGFGWPGMIELSTAMETVYILIGVRVAQLYISGKTYQIVYL